MISGAFTLISCSVSPFLSRNRWWSDWNAWCRRTIFPNHFLGFCTPVARLLYWQVLLFRPVLYGDTAVFFCKLTESFSMNTPNSSRPMARIMASILKFFMMILFIVRYSESECKVLKIIWFSNDFQMSLRSCENALTFFRKVKALQFLYGRLNEIPVWRLNFRAVSFSSSWKTMRWSLQKRRESGYAPDRKECCGGKIHQNIQLGILGLPVDACAYIYKV